jgi:hypothetical protein
MNSDITKGRPAPLNYHNTQMSTAELTRLRRPIMEGLNFLEQNKNRLDYNTYLDLFDCYQRTLNRYNNLIDTNTVQNQYTDPRTVVQVQPIVDGRPDGKYEMADWERQFTANNINLPSTAYNNHPPAQRFREIRDHKKTPAFY